jgi:hypothetical protein
VPRPRKQPPGLKAGVFDDVAHDGPDARLIIDDQDCFLFFHLWESAGKGGGSLGPDTDARERLRAHQRSDAFASVKRSYGVGGGVGALLGVGEGVGAGATGGTVEGPLFVFAGPCAGPTYIIATNVIMTSVPTATAATGDPRRGGELRRFLVMASSSTFTHRTAYLR